VCFVLDVVKGCGSIGNWIQRDERDVGSFFVDIWKRFPFWEDGRVQKRERERELTYGMHGRRWRLGIFER
jgi:hypothetical protein